MKDLTTVKEGKATTVQDRSGNCLTEDREILNRWTEYWSKLFNHKANGDPSVLNCLQTDIEDDHPILREEVEAAVQSLKKREISWSRQHPGRTVPSRRRGRNHHFHDNLQQDLADRRMANTVDSVLSHHTSQERQPAAVPELPNNKPYQSPEQSHAEDHTEETEATTGEDLRLRTARFQSRKEHHRADLQPTNPL